jgi:hypothetical protein
MVGLVAAIRMKIYLWRRKLQETRTRSKGMMGFRGIGMWYLR